MLPVLDDIGGTEKLKLVREIGAIRRDMPGVDGLNKLSLVKRVREIRVMLSLSGNSNPDELAIDTSDMGKSYEVLANYLNESVGRLPESLIGVEVATVRKIEPLFFKRSKADHPSRDVYVAAVSDKTRRYHPDEVGVFEHYKSLSNIPVHDASKIKSILESIDKVSSESPEDSPEVVSKMEEVRSSLSTVMDTLSSLRNVNSKNGYGKEDIDKAAHEYGLMIDKYREMDKKITSLARQKYEDKKARIEKLKEELRPVGESFINDLVSGSKVTQEQAESWASNQVISKSAITKLRKSGYKEADIRRDMAEFYRISGGKLRHISIETNGRRRASASGIGGIDGTVISPGSHFNKSVLWHEMAHHLEADPAAKTAANGFLVKRRKDAKVYSLRSLTGNKGYGSNEGAYKDDFISPYVGKVYHDGTTEVWAMGIQYLSNPADAAMILAKDPEMAALIAGYIRSDLTPGMKALQAAQDGAKNKSQAKRDDEKKQYQQAVNALSKDVKNHAKLTHLCG